MTRETAEVPALLQSIIEQNVTNGRGYDRGLPICFNGCSPKDNTKLRIYLGIMQADQVSRRTILRRLIDRSY